MKIYKKPINKSYLKFQGKIYETNLEVDNCGTAVVVVVMGFHGNISRKELVGISVGRCVDENE